MTATATELHSRYVDALAAAPTVHARLREWVLRIADLTTPDRIVWCDGSEAEWTRLTDELVAAGTLVALDAERKPNSFWARTDPSDVARVEERTFICSVDPADAGPTNNWMDPGDMRARMTELYAGCMRGRTLYVIPFCMGPLTAAKPMFGVEITDSPYVVASMRIMTRMGAKVLAAMGEDAQFVAALHSVGAPLEPGQADVVWPCNDDQVHLALPRDAGDLVLRLWLRRQLAAGQEVLLAADRERDGARRGVACRTHAHPQADLARGQRPLCRGGLSVRLRQDQPGDAGAHRSRMES